MYPCCGYILPWSIQPLLLLSLTPLPLTPQFSTAFNTHLYILYLHRCVLWYYWCSIILFSFPFFLKFHRVVPLLWTCSTSEFVYDHTYFLYILFIFGSIFHVSEKTCSFRLSEPGLLHLTWCPPIASIYHQTTCYYSLWLFFIFKIRN
jgi:hypothetical protein